MIKYGKLLIILVIIFASLFLINATVMYSLFGINVLRPGAVDNENILEQYVADELIMRTTDGEIAEEEFSTGKTTSDEIAWDEFTTVKNTTGEFADGIPGRSLWEDSDFNVGGSDSVEPEVYYMTADEVEFLKRRLGLADKISIMAIISRLEKDAIDEIYSLSLDGVTIDEFEEISGAMEDYLSEAEFGKLKRILNKSKMLYAQSGR